MAVNYKWLTWKTKLRRKLGIKKHSSTYREAMAGEGELRRMRLRMSPASHTLRMNGQNQQLVFAQLVLAANEASSEIELTIWPMSARTVPASAPSLGWPHKSSEGHLLDAILAAF